MQADTPGVIIWPPILYGFAVVTLLVLHWQLPLPMSAHPVTLWVGAALFFLGAAFNAWASLSMRRAGTNINPSLPAMVLVASGPFRLSRNPLYVAASIMFLGLSLIVNSIWGVSILVPVLFVMHYGVILREERYLEAKFGESYRQYCSAVRRYL